MSKRRGSGVRAPRNILTFMKFHHFRFKDEGRSKWLDTFKNYLNLLLILNLILRLILLLRSPNSFFGYCKLQNLFLLLFFIRINSLKHFKDLMKKSKFFMTFFSNFWWNLWNFPKNSSEFKKSQSIKFELSNSRKLCIIDRKSKIKFKIKSRIK